jgi:hypothetical protein
LGYHEVDFVHNFNGYSLYIQKRNFAFREGYPDLPYTTMTLIAQCLREISGHMRFYADFSKALAGISAQIDEHVSSAKLVIPVWGKLRNKEGTIENLKTHFMKGYSPKHSLEKGDVLFSITSMVPTAVTVEIWDESFVMAQEKRYSGN